MTSDTTDVRASNSGFRPASLDAVNFLLADVRGALGPYLNVFLVTQQHWTQASVGLVTVIGGLLSLAAQTPIGAAIDATRAKRGVIVAALVVLAAGATTIWAAPTFWPVMVANTLMAVAGDVFGPAVAGGNSNARMFQAEQPFLFWSFERFIWLMCTSSYLHFARTSISTTIHVVMY